MKNNRILSISKLRSVCVKKIVKNDFDYELPFMVLIVVLSAVLIFTVTI